MLTMESSADSLLRQPHLPCADPCPPAAEPALPGPCARARFPSSAQLARAAPTLKRPISCSWPARVQDIGAIFLLLVLLSRLAELHAGPGPHKILLQTTVPEKISTSDVKEDLENNACRNKKCVDVDSWAMTVLQKNAILMVHKSRDRKEKSSSNSNCNGLRASSCHHRDEGDSDGPADWKIYKVQHPECCSTYRRKDDRRDRSWGQLSLSAWPPGWLLVAEGSVMDASYRVIK
ncbi:Zinc finger protein 564 [Manis javanica]|nr:Zinc finger protein 564 [Manis javanica]